MAPLRIAIVGSVDRPPEEKADEAKTHPVDEAKLAEQIAMTLRAKTLIFIA
jgi:hypothetical protein